MAVETPEAQRSSRLCPQIQPRKSYSWRDVGLYEHSFALQSYGTSSVAMGDGTYFSWSYDLSLLLDIIKVSEQMRGEEWERESSKERRELWMNWSSCHALKKAKWRMEATWEEKADADAFGTETRHQQLFLSKHYNFSSCPLSSSAFSQHIASRRCMPLPTAWIWKNKASACEDG